MKEHSLFKRILSFLSGGRLFQPNKIEEKIQALIGEGEEEGQISKQEGVMIQGILELRDTLAREIMIPRTEMSFIQIDTPLDEVISLVEEKGHSRYPVYKHDIDDIIGFLHVKDLIPQCSERNGGISMQEVLRPCHFIPETRRLIDILRDFQTRRFHMAVVTDEYGGTSGIITIEDILEEIVGDIQDEHDHEEPLIHKIDDANLLVDARADIEDLEEYMGIVFPDGEYESVGGLIIHLVSRVPKIGEVIPFEKLEFIIEKADKRRIQTIKVRRLEGDVSPSGAE